MQINAFICDKTAVYCRSSDTRSLVAEPITAAELPPGDSGEPPRDERSSIIVTHTGRRRVLFISPSRQPGSVGKGDVNNKKKKRRWEVPCATWQVGAGESGFALAGNGYLRS